MRFRKVIFECVVDVPIITASGIVPVVRPLPAAQIEGELVRIPQ